MKEGQLLIVKFIKNEDDLPTENGDFIGFDSEKKKVIEFSYDPKSDKHRVDTLVSWLDWYLQPTEEQESKPIYDEAYLNECIAKAMPNLSKIKDVDKELAEIRGIEEQESIKHETCDGCAMFQDCGCMLDDSCPQCFEYSMWTAIDVEEQESISDEEADDTLLGLDGEETWLP